MEDLFNILSATARIDKSKRKKEIKQKASEKTIQHQHDDEFESVDGDYATRSSKRELSADRQKQIHREQMNAFRKSMLIKLASKNDPDVPDPISSFHELALPSWWNQMEESRFNGILRATLRNIEAGKWKEPTPIQMQALPTLLERRDFIGAAPTGSGKSGAFILPALILSSASRQTFYHSQSSESSKKEENGRNDLNQGEIRALLLAPSLELASQLHREVERLGAGKPGGLSSMLLSKSNAANVIAGNAGGKNGLDVLVSTPLRLIDSIEKGLKLNSVRIIILDEADRLLDATDGKRTKEALHKTDGKDDEQQISGSGKSRSFLAQMDLILSVLPATAIRALFSATVTSHVRSLAESILRYPVDVTIGSAGTQGAANPDIEQELMFVGKEEGKLLAIRQLVARGQLRPPVIIFLESQDRAQALFGELLYDGIHVDVIHAGRSKSARENAVAKFRKGDTWVLICTDLVARGVDFRAVNMVINYDLPSSGITYVHRIGRTGRAGRKGKAITLFTESDFENLRTIANVMKQSGCKIDDWMLNLRKRTSSRAKRRREEIDTTPKYDKNKRQHKQQIIRQNMEKKKAEIEKED